MTADAMLRLIRGSLNSRAEGINAGGDIEIMKAVDAIVKREAGSQPHVHYCSIAGVPGSYCCEAKCKHPCPDCPDESHQKAPVDNTAYMTEMTS